MVRLRGTSLSIAATGASVGTAVAGAVVAAAAVVAVAWGAAVGSSLSPLHAANVNSNAPASDRTIPARRSFGITVILPCIVSCAPGPAGVSILADVRVRGANFGAGRVRERSLLAAFMGCQPILLIPIVFEFTFRDAQRQRSPCPPLTNRQPESRLGPLAGECCKIACNSQVTVLICH